MRPMLITLLAILGNAAVAAPSLTTPPTAPVGSTSTLQATGSGNPREFVTVVPKGTREGAYQAYVYVAPGDQGRDLSAEDRHPARVRLPASRRSNQPINR